MSCNVQVRDLYTLFLLGESFFPCLQVPPTVEWTQMNPNEPNPYPLYWTYAQVAAATGLHRSSIKRAVARGDLVPLRVGLRNTRFRPEDVKNWIEKKNPTPSENT